MKDATRKILTLALFAVFLVSTTVFTLQFFDKRTGSEVYIQAESLAQIAPPETEPAEAVTEPAPIPDAPAQPQTPQWIPAPVEDDPYMDMLARTNFSALRSVNKDVVGWIYIPDTSISYPITQGEDNSYYLSHTWNGASNYVGSIFLETRNSADFTDFNTIVYGHNMRNGSMFSGLHDYTDLAHWQQHPYVYIATADGVFRYRIFASYNADIDSQTYGLSFRQTQTRENFIAMALENSDIDTGDAPGIHDRIVTLSTCTGLGYSQRRVVHAYLPMVQTQ